MSDPEKAAQGHRFFLVSLVLLMVTLFSGQLAPSRTHPHSSQFLHLTQTRNDLPLCLLDTEPAMPASAITHPGHY